MDARTMKLVLNEHHDKLLNDLKDFMARRRAEKSNNQYGLLDNKQKAKIDSEIIMEPRYVNLKIRVMETESIMSELNV